MNYYAIIPVLEKEVHFFSFDHSSYIVSQERYNFELNINKNTYLILQLVDGNKTLREISESYNQTNQENITVDFLHRLLYDKLSKYGIIKNPSVEVKPKSRAGYLKLSKIIIPENTVNKISNHLTFLFNPLVLISFIALISLSFLLLFGNYYDKIKLVAYNLSSLNYWYVAPLSFLALIIHELGHASAAKYCGINSKGIGFGFYLITPILFTDITKAWRLNNKQRVKIDLGGVYFELIFTVLLISVFSINHNINLLATSLFLTVNTLHNLNPFFRTDGYWILTDGLKIANLRRQSNERLRLLFRKTTREKRMPSSKKDWFLITYSLISWSFIFVFIISNLLWNTNSIMYFPFTVYHSIVAILHGKMNTLPPKMFSGMIIPFTFYFLFFRIIVQRLKPRNKSEE